MKKQRFINVLEEDSILEVLNVLAKSKPLNHSNCNICHGLTLSVKLVSLPVPSSVFLYRLLPWPIDRWISPGLDPVSWWGPAEGSCVSTRWSCPGGSRGLVGWPQAAIERLCLGGSKVIPGMVVSGMGSAWSLGSRVVGTCWVGVGRHWPIGLKLRRGAGLYSSIA